jgi:muramoyltetrapeptide carboxypeptidase
MHLQRPRLNPHIGVISPAYPPNEERLDKGIAYLQNRGATVIRGAHVSGKYGYLAARDEDRVADIHAMFQNPDVDLIICSRGGWGGLRMLDKLDYELIAANPKILVGYSDITTLQLALWQKLRLPSVSGPMVAVEMGKGILPFTESHFWGYLENEAGDYSYTYPAMETRTLRAGRASGTLLGGCLALVTTLLGTPYSPDYTGAILFLEDVGESSYKIDRYFAHLRQAGVFDQISGLILGDFLDCEGEESDFTVQELINEYFGTADYPVITDFPYGHGDRKISMPVGAKCTLDTEANSVRFSSIFTGK